MVEELSEPIKTVPVVKLCPILIKPVFTLLPIVISFVVDKMLFVFIKFMVVVPNRAVEEKNDPKVMFPVVKLLPIIIDDPGVTLSNLFALATFTVKSAIVALDTFKKDTFD
jgi:hypothetical protein